MNSQAIPTPVWSTASFAAAADTLPMELSTLGDHLVRCRGSRGRLFALRCAADTTHGFVAARFVTSLVVVTAVLAGVAGLVL